MTPLGVKLHFFVKNIRKKMIFFVKKCNLTPGVQFDTTIGFSDVDLVSKPKMVSLAQSSTEIGIFSTGAVI